MELQSTTIFTEQEENTSSGKCRKRLLEHKRSFIFHYDEMNVVMELDDAEAGKFLKSIVAYAILENGMTSRDDIELTDLQLEALIAASNRNKMLYVLFRQFIALHRIDNERYRRRVKSCSENGQKGGAPKGNSNAVTLAKNRKNKRCNSAGNAEKCVNISENAREEDNLLIFKEYEMNQNKNKSNKNNKKQAKQANIAKDRAKVRAKDRAKDNLRVPDGTLECGGAKKRNFDHQALMERFNATFDGILPKITIISKRRREAVNARIAELGEQSIDVAFKHILNSKFLRGGGAAGWRATFDWIFRPENYPKILEGNYDHDLRSTSPVMHYETPADRSRRLNSEVKQRIFNKAVAHIAGAVMTGV